MNKIKAISLVIPFKYDNDGNLLLWVQKRKSEDELDGFDEFPGGKIEANESPEEAAKREFLEEVQESIKDKDLSLLKIHNHSVKENFIFYIFGLHCKDAFLDEMGWNKVLDKSELSFSGELKIPPENTLFLRDILKTM